MRPVALQALLWTLLAVVALLGLWQTAPSPSPSDFDSDANHHSETNGEEMLNIGGQRELNLASEHSPEDARSRGSMHVYDSEYDVLERSILRQEKENMALLHRRKYARGSSSTSGIEPSSVGGQSSSLPSASLYARHAQRMEVFEGEIATRLVDRVASGKDRRLPPPLTNSEVQKIIDQQYNRKPHVRGIMDLCIDGNPGTPGTPAAVYPCHEGEDDMHGTCKQSDQSYHALSSCFYLFIYFFSLCFTIFFVLVMSALPSKLCLILDWQPLLFVVSKEVRESIHQYYLGQNGIVNACHGAATSIISSYKPRVVRFSFLFYSCR